MVGGGSIRTVAAIYGRFRRDDGSAEAGRVETIGGRPLTGRNGDLQLVADGRVHNRDELNRSLRLAEARSRHLDDDELILCAYEEWGHACLERLVGEFAFAVWEGRTRTLSLASSAPLSRPLFYTAARDVVAFASRPTILFTLTGEARRIDEQRLAGFLAGVDTGSGRSFYAGVQRLEAGHLFISDARHSRLVRWWDPELGESTLGGDDEYRDATSALLETCIREQLATPARVGAQLSGGLDSGTVAAIAARLLDIRGQRLAAFTEVPSADFAGQTIDGRYADETARVRAFAAVHPNVDLELVTARRGLLEGVDQFFDVAEVPFPNAVNRGWIEHIYARAEETGHGLLLTGAQGNLTVSWSGSGLLPGLVRSGHVVRALSESVALTRAGGARSTARAFLGQGVMPLLPPRVWGAAARLRGERRSARPWEKASLIHPAFADRYQIAERFRDREARLAASHGSASRALRLLILHVTGSMDSEIHAGYRTMFGVDTAVPLADRRLVEFCMRVPEEQFQRQGETRLLIRRVMAGRLPEATLQGTARGLQAAAWFDDLTRERPQLLDELARIEGDELSRTALDLDRLRGLMEQWPTHVPTTAEGLMVYRYAIPVALMTGRFLMWAQRN